MKKYLLGIMAIALAIGISSFTTKHAPVKKGNITLYSFLYTPTTDFSEDAVEDVNNWVINGEYEEAACAGLEQRACEIAVDESKITANKLNFTLTASPFVTDEEYYLEESSDVTVANNKSIE